MSTDFTSRKLVWLEEVARDRRVPRLALAVAVVLATKYVNGETGDAWPSIRTLAGQVGASIGGAHGAIDRLVELGWLDRAGGGPHQSSRYSIAFTPDRTQRSLQTERRRSLQTERCVRSRANRTREEPTIGTREGTPRPARRRRRDTSSRRQTRATAFPRGWRCGDAEADTALRSSARWGRQRALVEFDKFKDWHVKRGNKSAAWPEWWAGWCEKGSEIDRREGTRQHQRRDKVRSAVAGAASWLERQRAAAGYDLEGEVAEEEA